MSLSALSGVGGQDYRPAPAVQAEDAGGGGGRRHADRQPQTWSEALDEIEDDTHRAETTLAHATPEEIAAWGRRSSDWVPPSGLGPLPADLRERAARLLQHQLAVAEALVEGITQSRRQRDLAARMSQAPSRPTSSFIDRPV
ncbi:hypothetical protein SAMN05660199_00340 [Klenkia soli]|uniref:Uncharacterized protein n=1 Tax=Klenkia soli TaxID=1052260 RepID=A0A1H0CKZ4_9ACTN|nr:hypothetical protein [Klenkia soli]SDN58567.1 hypothetical protein SAMN05660199_00340 [Klenkia soli]